MSIRPVRAPERVVSVLQIINEIIPSPGDEIVANLSRAYIVKDGKYDVTFESVKFMGRLQHQAPSHRPIAIRLTNIYVELRAASKITRRR